LLVGKTVAPTDGAFEDDGDMDDVDGTLKPNKYGVLQLRGVFGRLIHVPSL
jgi:hypothetical protein